MNERNEEAVKIAENIIKNIEVFPHSLSNVRSFFRLVDMLKIKDEIEWINKELYGYTKLKDCPSYRKVKNKRYTNSFVTIGDDYTLLRIYANNKTTTYKKNKEAIIVDNNNWVHILDVVDNLIYQKTSRILLQLKFEKVESDIFDYTRNSIDKKLNDLCPTAFEKLTEIYEDAIESKSKLDLQQVAHGCRVVLKDFADAVYSPKDEKIKGSDGKEHDLKDNNYINRIIAYVQENTYSKSNKKFTKSHLNYLASFLDNVDELANTGTHTEITIEQANRCIINTYLVLGDIINLCSI